MNFYSTLLTVAFGCWSDMCSISEMDYGYESLTNLMLFI